MKNSLIICLMFLSSCSSIKQINHLSNDDVIEKLEKSSQMKINEVEVKETQEDLQLTRVKSFKGFSKVEIDKFWKYSDVVDNITHSKCFENYIKSYPGLLNNKNQTRDELLKELRSSKPLLNFVMYYKNNSTVGYTYPNSDTIWMNRKFHKNYSLAESAANLAHERSHKLGYTHDFNRSSRRSDQVPYPVGAGIKACAYDINYDLNKRERVRICYRNWKSLWLSKRCYWKIK